MCIYIIYTYIICIYIYIYIIRSSKHCVGRYNYNDKIIKTLLCNAQFVNKTRFT